MFAVSQLLSSSGLSFAIVLMVRWRTSQGSVGFSMMSGRAMEGGSDADV